MSAQVTETSPTSAAWLLYFRDARPPHEIVAALESDLMKVFARSMREGKLVYATDVKITGAPYQFELGYEGALLSTNSYSLRVNASWGNLPANTHAYFRKTADGWIQFWTRHFKLDDSAIAETGSPERYAQICTEAAQAEARLDSVPAIQQMIVAGVKRGATFSTAHKEGGSIFKWLDGQYIRSDYGDDPGLKKFADENDFLKALREFYHWTVSSAFPPSQPTEPEAWRLILRKLDTK